MLSISIDKNLDLLVWFVPKYKQIEQRNATAIPCERTQRFAKILITNFRDPNSYEFTTTIQIIDGCGLV